MTPQFGRDYFFSREIWPVMHHKYTTAPEGPAVFDMQGSQLAMDNEAEAAQLAAELPQKHQPLVNKTRYATPLSIQMRQLMRRFLLVYWRSPAYNVIS
jgi:hypothetical protein